jgi:hypothetical protein
MELDISKMNKIASHYTVSPSLIVEGANSCYYAYIEDDKVTILNLNQESLDTYDSFVKDGNEDQAYKEIFSKAFVNNFFGTRIQINKKLESNDSRERYFYRRLRFNLNHLSNEESKIKQNAEDLIALKSYVESFSVTKLQEIVCKAYLQEVRTLSEDSGLPVPFIEKKILEKIISTNCNMKKLLLERNVAISKASEQEVWIQ